MLFHLKSILHRECQIETDQSVLVGVSGGVDSLSLLAAMCELGYQVGVAHFDHGLRSNSNADLEFVRAAAEKRGCQFFSDRADTTTFARENHLSIEAAGRELRYAFLFEIAQDKGYSAVVTAHNADDQVETVLMHLLRGAGLAGLTGMRVRTIPNPWSNSIPLIRPLLETWRTEISKYCGEKKLQPIEDITNRDTKYFRNRLRHELFPLLEKDYIPGLRQRLWQTTNLLAADHELVTNVVNQSWDKDITEINPNAFSLNLATFNHHPLGLQRRLIRRALANLRPDARDIDFAMVQRVLDFCDQPSASRKMDFGLGIWGIVEMDTFILTTVPTQLPSDQWPQLAGTDSKLVVVGSPIEVGLGREWRFFAQFESDLSQVRKLAQQNRDYFQAWLSIDTENVEILLRTRCVGDRFQPLGMAGRSMKLSDFMINEKMPVRARKHWPLVCLGADIIWVPGYRLAHPHRITGESRKILYLRLENTKR
jgi:tRNA(Ile)-lysidine synthase